MVAEACPVSTAARKLKTPKSGGAHLPQAISGQVTASCVALPGQKVQTATPDSKASNGLLFFVESKNRRRDNVKQKPVPSLRSLSCESCRRSPWCHRDHDTRIEACCLIDFDSIDTRQYFMKSAELTRTSAPRIPFREPGALQLSLQGSLCRCRRS